MFPSRTSQIRSATPANAAAIRNIVRAAYAKWIPALGHEPLPMQADYERAVREHQIDLLYVDGLMVGLIEMIVRNDHLYIENVAIAPEHQGQGLGRQLLGHAEQVAIARGYRDIRLLANAVFDTNISLYKTVGYRIDREEPFMGGIAVYMSKKVA
jgi:ribosomal protein S18 acetylase RimI-like enzyme